MVDSQLRWLYERLPVPLQNLAVSIQGYRIRQQRLGGDFKTQLRAAEQRDKFNCEQMRQYQQRRLSNFLKTAVTAPFWRHRFNIYGVEPTADDPFSELQKLPVLTKDEVKDADLSLVPATIKEGELLSTHTSGTTGSGLQFYETRDALQEQWAVWWRYRRRLGIDRETWHGYFGGHPIVPVGDGPPYWRINYPGKQVLFSTYHICPDTIQAFLNAIRERSISWLHGYPSALSLLANLTPDDGHAPPSSVNIVTTGAETLFDHQRHAIEQAFDARVRQHYGLEEAVANISECPHGTLHVDEDFSYVEFVEGGNGHRIVGTNWSNPAFPLLRYDTGDIAELGSGECSCDCPGRTITSLLGRQEDYIIIPGGARVGRLDHIFKDATTVQEAQIYQPNKECLIFRVVPGDDYSEEHEASIRAKARERLGDEIDIEFDYLDSVPRTNNGKIRFVVSDIDEMQINPGS